MNVLSLFDGISAGQVAFDEAGIFVNEYFASEINKYAISVTQHNFPYTQQIGDVRNVRYEDGTLYWKDAAYDTKIDMVVGGSPCFVGDTKVICINGIKEIKDIKVGDFVLTHSGKYKKVISIGNKKSKTYSLLSQSATTTETTGNHPYYIRTRNRKWDKEKRKMVVEFTEPYWKNVKDIEKGDYVATPILQTNNNPNNLTEDECFIIGLYIGDGHTRKDYRISENRPNDRYWQLIISVGEHEKELLESKITIKHSSYPHTKSTYRFVFSNKRLVEYVEKNCGIGAFNKYLSKDILDLPNNLLEKILDGYFFADGSYRRNTHRATTISKHLVETLTLAIAKKYRTTTCVEFTKRPKTTVIEGRVVNQKHTHTISFRKKHPKKSRAYVIGEYVYNPVKIVKKSNTIKTVYNLEVEDDNSYVANNHIVHNCQGFSKSGKGLNFKDSRSALFFEYIRILREVNPKYFLLENVVMKKEWIDIISEKIGVEPIRINSNKLSAQNRDRLYWTNIPGIKQPTDLGLTFGDIRQYDVEDKYYYTEKGLEWIGRHSERTGKKLRIWDDDTKVQMLEQTMSRLYSSQRFFGIPDTKGLRYITPVECEAAQGFPSGYTEILSKTRRYNVLGDSWTVPIISHIFSFIK